MKWRGNVILILVSVVIVWWLMPTIIEPISGMLDQLLAWWTQIGWKVALISFAAGALTYVSPWHDRLARRFLLGGALCGIITGVAPYLVPALISHIGQPVTQFIMHALHLV